LIVPRNLQNFLNDGKEGATGCRNGDAGAPRRPGNEPIDDRMSQTNELNVGPSHGPLGRTGNVSLGDADRLPLHRRPIRRRSLAHFSFNEHSAFFESQHLVRQCVIRSVSHWNYSVHEALRRLKSSPALPSRRLARDSRLEEKMDRGGADE
jgi:hypothetical protein